MIWGNPWALLGFTAIAVPIVVHLLAREASRAVPFPTLRFLRAAPLLDVRRRRLSDLLLLLLRIAIIALAAAALAQPFVSQTQRAGSNRLVIIDATASVDVDAAREAARSYEEGASAFTVIERHDLASALRDAGAWARSTAGSSTVIVISDFQRGAIDPGMMQDLPPTTGVALRRVARRDLRTTVPGVERMSLNGARTEAAWRGPSASAEASADDAIQIDGALDAATNAAIVEAARATAAAHTGQIRPVTFVLPDSPRLAALVEASEPASEPWMFSVMTAITAGHARTVMAADGRALVFLASSDPAVVADAIREAIPALSTGPAIAELEPLTLSDDELRAMERQAAPGAPLEVPQSWAGRWFWIAALVLLGVEALMRRTRRTADEELARAA